MNPCLTTTWNTNAINSMTSTVLSVTPVVQTFTACSVLATSCGSVAYSLNQTLSFLTLNSSAMTISVSSSNTADAGTFYLGLFVSLVTYPTINQTLPFTVTISTCVVTSIVVATGAFNTTANTSVNIFDTIGLSIPIPTFT